MILIFIKSYLLLFIIIGLVSTLLFIGGVFFIIKLFRSSSHQYASHPAPNQNISHHKTQITSADIRAIAGEDELSTQLDLARAYIDVGKKQLAQKMLNHILQQGSIMQQQAARELMGLL